MLAVVQAMLIRQLAIKGSGQGSDALSTSRESAAAALLDCLAGIIWSTRVGRMAQVAMCKAQELPPMREAAEYIRITECKSEADVREALQAAAGSYVRPRGGGVALLLYSVLLTRGVAMVARDADFPSSLILPNGYCSQELVNLLLIGRGFSNVFDGERTVGGEGGDGEGTRLRGIPRRAPIGFLTLFERQGSLLHQSGERGDTGLVKVGSNYKRPLAPVYVVQSEAHYSVLWLASEANPELTDPDEQVLYGDGAEDSLPPLHEPEPELAQGASFDAFYFDQVRRLLFAYALCPSARLAFCMSPWSM